LIKKPLKIEFLPNTKYHEMTGDFIKIYYCNDCYEMYFEDEKEKHEGHVISWLYQGQNACIVPERREKCNKCGATWEISQLNDENHCNICVQTIALEKEMGDTSPLVEGIRLLKSQKRLNKALKIHVIVQIALAGALIHLIWRLFGF